MRSVTVLSALFDEASNQIHVVKRIENDDGSIDLNLHAFATDALEWCAALHGVDDVPTLIDIILYEPLVSASDSPTIEQISATKKTLTKISKTTPILKATQKELDKAQLQTAGVDERYINAMDSDPYEEISKFSLLGEKSLRVKKQYVKDKRERPVRPQPAHLVDDDSRSYQLHNRLIERPTMRTAKQKADRPTGQQKTITLVKGKKVR